jgi:hypothetical protein
VHSLAKAVLILAGFALIVPGAVSQKKSSDADRSSIVIVFKDGHRQSFPVEDVARIEFQAAAAGVSQADKNRFVGKWEVGTGTGAGKTFFITLDADGTAKKSIGATHGKWTVENGEAHISWDDGWHDAIRKIGGKHEKFAYGPGKSFSDQPDNVTDAKNTLPKPL